MTQRPTALRIASPCPEPWAAMTPTATGRHCAACQKTVIDFTWKTDAEILTYLAGASGETCGRLRADQQNRVLVAAPTASPVQRWRTWLAAALALWSVRELGSQEAEAHAGLAPSAHHTPTKARAPRHTARATRLLHGVVRDATTHEPLIGVAIFLRGENRSTTTDSSGRFNLRLPAGRPAGSRRQLVLHRTGYLSRQLLLAPAPGAMQLALHSDPAATGVEVVAIYQEQRREIMGGAIATVMVADEKPPTSPAARPVHGFFYWLTRPFRRS